MTIIIIFNYNGLISLYLGAIVVLIVS